MTFSKISDTIDKYKLDDRDKYISAEFQKYAYDLAVELGDLKHKSLYMKLAKNTFGRRQKLCKRCL